MGMSMPCQQFRERSPSDPTRPVIDYLKDFGNAEEWDPGTQSCTRSDSGPIREGADVAQRVQDRRRHRRS